MDIKEASKISFNVNNRHPWELARVKIIEKHICKYFSKDVNAKILDLGSGDAFVTTFLAKKYEKFDIYAIDTAYDEILIKLFEEKINLKNVHLHSSVNDDIFENINFDVILLNDVIEHIEDDILFLNNLANRKFITDKTIFIISVPSYQFLFTSHDEFLGHFRRYNNALLKNNVEKAGLEVLEIGYFFFTLVPVRLIQKILEQFTKKKNKPKDLSEWKGNIFISKIFENILLLEYTLSKILRKIGIKLPGLSNYAICKKQQ
jgi:2-polyprenyl-3-methyl-5-hydroxy-6-metoxy-1,4-benzoquinol methylase